MASADGWTETVVASSHLEPAAHCHAVQRDAIPARPVTVTDFTLDDLIRLMNPIALGLAAVGLVGAGAHLVAGAAVADAHERPAASLAAAGARCRRAAAGSGLRFHDLGAQSLWNDEGNSVVQASRSLAEIAEHAARDIHPPGYYWLLSGWTGLTGTSEFALRAFSALASVLSVAFALALGRRLYGVWAGLVGGAVGRSEHVQHLLRAGSAHVRAARPDRRGRHVGAVPDWCSAGMRVGPLRLGCSTRRASTRSMPILC